jgi:hypothetical protein
MVDLFLDLLVDLVQMLETLELVQMDQEWKENYIWKNNFKCF